MMMLMKIMLACRRTVGTPLILLVTLRSGLDKQETGVSVNNDTRQNGPVRNLCRRRAHVCLVCLVLHRGLGAQVDQGSVRAASGASGAQEYEKHGAGF